MLAVGVIIAVLMTIIPGMMIVSLLRVNKIRFLDSILYAVGFGVVFNLAVGLVANFTLGMRLSYVLAIYIAIFGSLAWVAWNFGYVNVKWWGWKPIVIPLCIYLLAVALQLQTTLVSPNLVGSDIHLEYFVSNQVLEHGYWNPSDSGTTLNACLGIAVLIPVYKLLTGMTLVWVFKLIAPLMFAVLPLIMYRIFKPQFGGLVSVLAVIFFVTMPMFTMDLVQLVRQQQAELFLVFVLFALLDDKLSLPKKVVLGVLFSGGVLVSHVGTAIGFVGYLISGVFVTLILVRFWRDKVSDARRPMVARITILVLAVLAVVGYMGYYGAVSSGRFLMAGMIPMRIATNTISQTLDGAKFANPSVNLSLDIQTDKKQNTPSFFDRFSSLDPIRKEPLAQTAIGLDFGKASSLGRVWRVFQYLVEICLIVGFLKLLFRPPKRIKVEYVAFVVSSFMVLAGIYLLSSYGWGLGTPRVWGITLLFISPFFVVGAGTIGKVLFGWLKINSDKLVLSSTLVVLVPYFVFNSGVVFELAKMKPEGFIDVPYSIALSSGRVDIATVFTNEDIEAMDKLKEIRVSENETPMLYADAHGGSLVVQRIGLDIEMGQYKFLWLMKDSDRGYIFLRKWNVDNSMITLYKDYATRESHTLSDYPILEKKIEDGEVVFDNGARIIKIR